ncbi:MAG TPA: YqjK family protein [Burkholderiales bacterium]|nr:YqjK family protein [Burkholderiales bacterium]
MKKQRRRSLREVLGRRASLVESAQSQREWLARDFQALRGPTRWVDKGMEGAHYLRQHPLVLVGAGVVVLVVLRRPLVRGGWLRLIRRGFVLWRGFVTVRSVAMRLAR